MTASPLSAEAQLVLLSAGGPENDAAIRALIGDGAIRWRHLALLANAERATPALWRRLRKLEGARGVEAGLAQLEPAARVWEFRLAILEQRLFRLLEAFDDAGIEVVLLKGAGLAYTTYGAFGDRPMSDLDLLVATEQAEAAWRLAQGLGWRWSDARYPLSIYEGHHHLPSLHDELGTGAGLEIHTGMFRDNPFGLTAALMWATARTIRVGGVAVRVPRPIHQLLHTCIHFAWAHQLCDGTWRSLRDVWALSEDDELSWDAFTEAAQALRAEACCYWTLRIAKRLARIAVPGTVLEQLRPRRLVGPMRGWLGQHYQLNALPTEDGCPSATLSILLWRMGGQPKRPEGIVAPDEARPPLRSRLSNHLQHRDAWLRYYQGVFARG